MTVNTEPFLSKIQDPKDALGPVIRPNIDGQKKAARALDSPGEWGMIYTTVHRRGALSHAMVGVTGKVLLRSPIFNDNRKTS